GPKVMQTQIVTLPGRNKPYVIVGVALALISLGIVIIGAAKGDDDSGPATAGSAVKLAATADAAVIVAVAPTDAAIDAPPEPPPIDGLVAQLHAALARAKPDELALMFDEHAFAFGIEANEVAEGRSAVIETIRHDIGTPPAHGFDV